MPKSKSAYYLKFVRRDNEGRLIGPYAQRFCYTPGVWTPNIPGKLIPCLRGYHILRPRDIVDWRVLSYNCELWLIRALDAHVTSAFDGWGYESKFVSRRIKLIRRVSEPNDELLIDAVWTKRRLIDYLAIRGVNVRG